MNVVSIVGRLTRDAELRYTPSGTAYARFTVAVNRRVPNQEGVREADFINCVAWNRTAEVISQYTKKGSQVGIQGRIQTGSYENQQGQRVYTTDVIVENFDFLEPRSTNNEQRTQVNQYDSPIQNDFSANQFTNDFSDIEISDDDLPF